jgi:hypothetical protein
MAPAIRRSRTAGSKSRACLRRRSRCSVAFAGRDDIGRGAGTLCFGNLDLVLHVERRGNTRERSLRLREHAGAEIAAGNGDAQAISAAIEEITDRLERPIDTDGIIGVVTLHGVIGEREIAGGAGQRPDVVEARHERERVGARQPAVGRLQPKTRTATTAHGSSHWYPSRARAAPIRRDRGGAAGRAPVMRVVSWDCARHRRARSRR